MHHMLLRCKLMSTSCRSLPGSPTHTANIAGEDKSLFIDPSKLANTIHCDRNLGYLISKLLTHFEAHEVSYQLFITSTLTSEVRGTMLSIHCSLAKKHNLVLMGHVMRLYIRILVYQQSNKLMYNTMISHHKNGYSVQWLELERPEPHVANETHTTYI